MPKGRKKKPDAIKKLEGNPGKRDLNDAAPIPDGRAVKPDYLNEEASDIWDQIVGSMPPELYKACDSSILGAFCVAVSQYRESTLLIEKEGMIVTSKNGSKITHPAQVVQYKAITAMVSLGARLGLEPSARASLKMPIAQKKTSKFEGLVSIPGGKSGTG